MLFLWRKFDQKRALYMLHWIRLSFLLILLMSLAACEQDKQGPYTINVTVENEDGIPIQNCELRLYAPVGTAGTVNYYAATGIDGRATFEYDYPAYLRIDAVKSSWRACGFVELADDNVVSRTIVIKPFGDPDNGCPPL